MEQGKPARLIDPEGNNEIELPVMKATMGRDTIDISELARKTRYFTFDTGFVSTASCESKITYIDGNKGELSYRGYPIEELAEQSSFLEGTYLLYYGNLPTRLQLDAFQANIATHAQMDEKALGSLYKGFPQDAHPMAMLMAAVSYLAALHHHEKDVYNPEYQDFCTCELIAKIPIIVSWAQCHHTNAPFILPQKNLSYTRNFLAMLFGNQKHISDTFVKAMDLILLLHADHEQNASTSAVRLTGSTETSPYAAITAGVASLWGPAHGGANEAVIRMLEEIVKSGQPIKKYINRAKNKNDSFRLMGFGHRIYKNYDPRAKIIRAICHNLLAELGKDDPNKPLLSAAMELESIALKDDYFISRRLYPNVDFYSGIILSAMELSPDMFTAIFALARTAGWLSHWHEMMSTGHAKIYRPRQLYTGQASRHYVPIEQRQGNPLHQITQSSE